MPSRGVPDPEHHASRVLVVDDDRHVVALLHDALGVHEIEVGSARDGSQALSWIRTHGAPSAIVTDLDMPREDGRQLLAALHRDPALAAIPVFVLTGSPVSSTELDNADGVAVLNKATQLSELVALVVSAATDGHSSPAAVEVATAEADVPSAPADS